MFGVYALSVAAIIATNVKTSKQIFDMTDFSKRLRDARKDMKLSLDAFGALADVTGAAQSNYENGKRSPTVEYLERLGSHGVDVVSLLSGADLTNVNKNRGRTLSGAAMAPGDDADTVYLSVMSACGSMGPGNELLTDDVLLGEVPFSRRWLSLNIPGCRPDALRLIHAYGDSMAGTLNSGDFAVIDTSCCTVDYPGVYLLHVNRLLFIKRVSFRMDGRMVVSSDNPAAPMAEVLDGGHQLDVRGRVVYGWNGKRF